MKARTRRLYLVLIGAAAVAAGQEWADLDGMVSTRSLAHAQSLPPMSPPESAGMPPLPEGTPPEPGSGLPPMAMPEASPPPIDAPVPPVVEAPSPVSPERDLLANGLTAKTLKEIDFQPQAGGINVILKGDGQFTYDISRQRNRLVVDLEDVINGTKHRTLAVRHPLLKQVRIGSHLQPQRKVRLVMDLSRPISYTVEKNGQDLRIMLTDAAPASQTQLEDASVSPDSDKARREEPPVRIIAPAKPSIRVQAPAGPPASPRLRSMAPGESSERYAGKRISLDFQDAEITSVLRLIADVSGYNMVVGEGAKAKVSLKLLNVPWDQALELILKLNQLGQIREGNIIWIDSLTNIAKQKDDAVRAHESTVKAEPLATRIMYLNYADASKSLDIVKSNLSNRGEVKVDLRTNGLVVKDIPDHLRKIERLLRDLDRITPQVQIESRIVQASKAFARGLGVQWGISGINSTSSTNFTGNGALHSQGPVILNLGRTGGAFSTDSATSSAFLVDLAATATGANIPTSVFGLTVGKFLGTSGTLDLRLSAGESLGLTKIVSAPKIITLDHKPAKIEQGSQVPFQTTSLQGTQTTFVDATLTLNVTPHVIPFAQTIRLEIKATKNSIGAAVSTAGPTIDKKEATTEVLLRDGETTVLGGIFEDNRTDNTAGIPWFNRIPFLGWLFKNEAVTLTQTELLIFVTPIILKD
jgi:type IV pilus assembly protein PilQ